MKFAYKDDLEFEKITKILNIHNAEYKIKDSLKIIELIKADLFLFEDLDRNNITPCAD